MHSEGGDEHAAVSVAADFGAGHGAAGAGTYRRDDLRGAGRIERGRDPRAHAGISALVHVLRPICRCGIDPCRDWLACHCI